MNRRDLITYAVRLARPLRIAAVDALIALRMPGAARRPFPAFIIVGAQRAGTTSLYEYLGQHPQVRTALKKEVHYFDLNYAKPPAWYRCHFPVLPSPGPAAGESSPYYLFHPYCAERIHALMPQARLIFLLRNPVERAISHYRYEKARREEHLSMLEAFMSEEQRLAPELKRLEQDPRHFSNIHMRQSYKARGRYAEQIHRYRARFPSEQMLILRSEDLFAQPEAVLRQVFRFIGVDDQFIPPNLSPQNTGGSKGRLPDEVTSYLGEYFRPHNQALYELIGRDMGW